MEIDIIWAIRCEAYHFLLSGFVGLLGYWLISTILLRTTYFQKQVGVFSTHQFSLLVALCFAVLAHILQDYLLGWF